MRPFFLAVIFVAVLAIAHRVEAQPAGGAWSSPEAKVQVVDAATGASVAGAIVVVRWDWEKYYPGFYNSSPKYLHEGEELVFFELVTDAKGNASVPGWGPIVRTGGRVDSRGARILVFKSGYAPLEASAEKGHFPRTLKLLQPHPSPREHAKQVAQMQGRAQGGPYEDLSREGWNGGLRWERAGEGWKRMPRMVKALHEEKMRLGEDGWAILGVHQLSGRSGKGELVRAEYDKVRADRPGPPPAVVLEVTWRILRSDNPGVDARFVQQRVMHFEATGTFHLSPWRYPQAAPPGWRLDTAAMPTLRIFSAGYSHVPERRWEEAGGTINLHPLPPTREGLLGELRAWRGHIDAALVRGDPEQSLAAQVPLAWLLARECERLTADARVGICLDSDVPIAKLAAERTAVRLETHEDAQGTYARNNPRGRGGATVAASIAGRSVATAGIAGKATGTAGAANVPAPSAAPAKPVGGFSIAPAGRAK